MKESLTAGQSARLELNSQSAIEGRVEAKVITWRGPLLMVFARLVLAFAAQALVALLFAFRSSSAPWLSAARWWPVYAVLIDLSCLALMVRLTRREGIHLLDLVSFDRKRLGSDVLLGLGFGIVFLPIAVIGIVMSNRLVNGILAPLSIYSPLPVWAVIYSLLVFPLIWGMVEQLTYQGYALPRLQALTRKSWVAVVLVTFGWAVQHVGLPSVFDLRYMLVRLLSFLPLALVMTVVYLRVRRLLPFFIAHWAMDFLGVVSGILVPMMRK